MLRHSNRLIRRILLTTASALWLCVASDVRAGTECVGDCDLDGTVRISEIIRGVNIGLGGIALDACPAADANGDRWVTIDEVVLTVRQGLEGCAVSSVDQLDVGDDFDYATARDVLFDITVLTPNGRPFAGVLIKLFGEAADSAQGGDLIHEGITGTDGHFRARIRIPGHLAALSVTASAIGIANRALVPISGNAATHVFD